MSLVLGRSNLFSGAFLGILLIRDTHNNKALIPLGISARRNFCISSELILPSLTSTTSDRVNGTFGSKWGEWHQNGWFDIIAHQVDGNLNDVYEDGDSTIGLMRGGGNIPFEYWIGCFVPENTTVPDGFNYIDFSENELGVCWIYGKEDEVYFHEMQCGERLEKDGFHVKYDWCMERYVCPRFTAPDEKGNIILDICFFLK